MNVPYHGRSSSGHMFVTNRIRLTGSLTDDRMKRTRSASVLDLPTIRIYEVLLGIASGRFSPAVA